MTGYARNPHKIPHYLLHSGVYKHKCGLDGFSALWIIQISNSVLRLAYRRFVEEILKPYQYTNLFSGLYSLRTINHLKFWCHQGSPRVITSWPPLAWRRFWRQAGREEITLPEFELGYRKEKCFENGRNSASLKDTTLESLRSWEKL